MTNMKIIGEVLITVNSDGRTSFGGPLLKVLKRPETKPTKHSPFIKEVTPNTPPPVIQISIEEEEAVRVWKVKEEKARVEAENAQIEMDKK